ncbi:MAG: SHOCT domain-containing protein [Chlorobi bacterium]|nr:SHOCT domain-containing protein [Chlorobiota bacterium]
MWTEHFWMGGMWIFPLIFLTVIIIFVFILLNRGGFGPPWSRYDRDSYGNRNEETPLEILKKRYARGEISKEEFEKIKKDIL